MKDTNSHIQRKHDNLTEMYTKTLYNEPVKRHIYIVYITLRKNNLLHTREPW